MPEPSALPTHFVQIIMIGGWVMDFSEETWELLRPEIRPGSTLVEATDIYGCDCWIVPSHVVGARHWTPESKALFQENHSDDDDPAI